MYHVSIMMRIFYIDWQQHWECDRTMNIGANAHGELTVSTKQPQVTDFRWQLGFQWHRRGIELVLKSLDCFTKWLFHSTTIFFFFFMLPHMYLLFETSPGWLQDWRVFWVFFLLTSIWWGNTQLQCIYYLLHILISRPPRVFWRFKRRPCCKLSCQLGSTQQESILPG